MLVLGTCLAASIVMSWASARVLEKFLRSGAEQPFRALVEHADETYQAWHDQGQEATRRAAADEDLSTAVAAGSIGRPRVRRILDGLVGERSALRGAAIVDAKGHVLGRARDQLPSDWPSQVGARKTDALECGVVRIGERSLELISSPLAAPARGALLLVVSDPAALLAPIQSLAGPTRMVALLDERGARVDGSNVAAQLSPPADVIDEREAEDGGRFLATAHELGHLRFRVVIAEPASVAFAPVAAAISQAVLANVLVACAAGAVAFLVGIWRLRPVLDLAEGARRLAAGELGVRVRVGEAEDEVQLLARSFNEMAERLESQRRALEERNLELVRANEVLEQLSITDGLTRLHNHRHFHDQFAREAKRADRSGQPLCLMLVDLDDFKQLNDQLGHSAGDRVLAVAARLMNDQIRESDYIARYGGEEFAMLLPQTPLEGAVALAEKLRSEIGRHAFVLPESETTVHVTVSVGVAEHARTTSATFEAADRALYEAKATGKDCVMAAGDSAASEPSPRRRR